MSSILEKFLFIFDSDASGVKKGAKEAKETTDKLNATLSTTDVISNKMAGSFNSLIKKASGAILALVSVGALISGIRAAADYANRLEDLSKALNVNVEDLSAWGDAVKKNGGSAEEFQATVKSMTAAFASFATKGTSLVAPFFQELKIKMTDSKGRARDFLEVLPEIADAFQHLSKSESFGIGQKMGLDQGTILLLQQGRREVEEIIKRQKELGVVTKLDAEIAAKFNNQLDDTAHAFRSLFTTINASVLPALTGVFKTFETVAIFLRKHSDLIVGGLTAIGAVVAYFLAPAFASLTAAALPFILIGAAIAAVVAAFALLYEDLKHFEAGNDSVIGDIVAKWPIVGDVLRTIAKIFHTLLDLVKATGKLLIDIFLNPLNAWSLFRSAVNKGIGELLNRFPILKTVVEAIGKAFTTVGETIASVWDSIMHGVEVAVEGIVAAIDAVINAYEKVKSFLGFDNKTTVKAVNTGQQVLGFANNHPLTSQTSNSLTVASKSNSKTTTVNTGDITINTQATDANGIAGALGGSLDNQMRQAVNNFDDGVLA